MPSVAGPQVDGGWRASTSFHLIQTRPQPQEQMEGRQSSPGPHPAPYCSPRERVEQGDLWGAMRGKQLSSSVSVSTALVRLYNCKSCCLGDAAGARVFGPPENCTAELDAEQQEPWQELTLSNHNRSEMPLDCGNS